jgi:hypothetical protein
LARLFPFYPAESLAWGQKAYSTATWQPQRKLPTQGESTKYTFASEDDPLHKMTRFHLLNGLDTWICTSCKVAMSSLVVPCQICNSYILLVPLQIDEFEVWVNEQWEKANVRMMKSLTKEETVVDMKAAAQHLKGATWQTSVEAMRPQEMGQEQEPQESQELEDHPEQKRVCWRRRTIWIRS